MAMRVDETCFRREYVLQIISSRWTQTHMRGGRGQWGDRAVNVSCMRHTNHTRHMAAHICLKSCGSSTKLRPAADQMGLRFARFSGGWPTVKRTPPYMSESKLAEWCFEVGFLKDRRETLCPKCGKKELKLHGDKASYICKNATTCRYEEACVRREPGLFADKVSLSKQMQIIYRMVYHNAPGKRECAADADLDPRVVARIQANVRQLASYWMIRANSLLQVGGEDLYREHKKT
jgi:hypothetical protein